MTVFEKRPIRVLDLSMGWAGPLAGQILAEMGAEVVKVEDIEHFDWWRGAAAVAPPEMRPIERSFVFNSTNRGKLGVTLDLRDPQGLALAKRLIAVSDIVIENYSPEVMPRLGLDWSTIRAINPRCIMISMPSFGSDGPESNARGYGNTVEAMAGITGLLGYEDSPQRYTMSNAFGDPFGALNASFAILAALHERERTGLGQRIELAQVEAAIPVIGREIVEQQLTGEAPRARGNRHPEHAPHGLYRCAGDEQNWIALAVPNDDQWRTLCATLMLDQLASDPRFADAKRRKDNEDSLDSELRNALRSVTLDDALTRLNAAGVDAAPVNSAAMILGDSHLQSRGYFVAIDRAVVGTHLYPGAAPRLSETPLVDDRPSPTLGEHNRDVFTRLLHLSETEIADLQRASVIGTEPRVRPKSQDLKS